MLPTLILCATMQAQICNPYSVVTAPVVQSGTPIQIKEEIYFDYSKIKSQKWVYGSFPDGSKFRVPIINGLKPLVRVHRALDSFGQPIHIRKFTYASNIKWTGDNPTTYVSTRPSTSRSNPSKPAASVPQKPAASAPQKVEPKKVEAPSVESIKLEGPKNSAKQPEPTQKEKELMRLLKEVQEELEILKQREEEFLKQNEISELHQKGKSLPSDIESEEPDFTKKFPRYN